MAALEPAPARLGCEIFPASLDRRDRVVATWQLAEDITTRSWGLRDFRLLDPDGYYWRVTTRTTGGARAST